MDWRLDASREEEEFEDFEEAAAGNSTKAEVVSRLTESRIVSKQLRLAASHCLPPPPLLSTNSTLTSYFTSFPSKKG